MATASSVVATGGKFGATVGTASGHLTPKLSIKRNVLMKHFAAQAAEIYNETTATTTVPLG